MVLAEKDVEMGGSNVKKPLKCTRDSHMEEREGCKTHKFIKTRSKLLNSAVKNFLFFFFC